MKKVINGALYNTETAHCLGYVEPAGTNERDFSYYRETLYCTKAGKYFLHGEGNADSRYGVWHGNTGGWGEQIIPLKYEEAMKWTENNLSGEEYIKAFGEPEEASENKEPLNLTVSPEVKAKLERLKKQTGKSISKLIEEKFIEE